MSKLIMTVCTSDWYQHFIPLFVYSIMKTWKDVDFQIYLMGKVNPVVDKAISCLHSWERGTIIENYKTDYPIQNSTPNSLRFTTEQINYDDVFVTDIDMFFVPLSRDIFIWSNSARDNESYVGCHSPLYKPARPEVWGDAGGWKGDFKRIAGGFVMLYPEWWKKTVDIRKKWDAKLKSGEWGKFREADEVMLCRMVREAGLPVPAATPLPRELRNVHLGDFRPNMKHRYTNRQKMRCFMDDRVVKSFYRAKSDKTFVEIRNILSENAQIKAVLDNAVDYCDKRVRGEM